MGKTLPLFPLPGIFWKILLQDIPSAQMSIYLATEKNMAQLEKNPPAMRETSVRSLG